jgi:hypothetical protein
MAKSKYSHLIHPISNGRVVVGWRREDGRWESTNTEEDPGKHAVIGHSPLDLVAKKIRTYANKNAAVKAVRRLGLFADDVESAEEKEKQNAEPTG